MTSIQLRSILTQDAPFLHTLMNTPALMARLHQPATTLRDWEEAIRLWHSDPDEKGFIVAADDQPIGWFAVNNLLSPARIPYIKMAALLPAHQHRGIGRKVIEQLCSQLQSEGYPAVRLFTDQDNLPAQRCYQSCGFRIIATLEEPWPDGTSLLRCEMEKTLQEVFMKQYETPHYIFHYAPGSLAEAEIAAIAAEQEACYAYICQVLGVAPDSKISYFLCDSPEEVGRIYGDNEPCNGFCVMPDKVYAVYNEKVKCIGFHEDAHIISYSTGRPDCPALREGLAMYFDRKWWGIHNMDWTAYYLRTGAYVPVHTLLDREAFFDLSCDLTYPIMGAFTDYLIATYGMERYKQVYRQGDIPAAMEAAYGQTPQQLNDAFVTYVQLFRLDEAVASRMEALLAET